MDKRIEANRRVRRQIVEALLDLMETQSFSEISVLQIVEQAGVSRQSYYRNFGSKEAIVEAFYAGIRAEVLTSLEHMDRAAGSRQLVLTILGVLEKNREGILRLYHGGFSKFNLELINQYIEEAAGDMPARSPARYRLYCFTGAIYNAALTWLSEGAKESKEELAEIICGFCASDLRFETGHSLP